MKSLVDLLPNSTKVLNKQGFSTYKPSFVQNKFIVFNSQSLPILQVQFYSKPTPKENKVKGGRNPTKVWLEKVRESWSKPLTQSQLDMLPPRKRQLRDRGEIQDKAPLRLMKPATAQPLREPLFKDVEVPVYNFLKEKVGTVTLPKEIFQAPVRKDILHRCVTWQLAFRRAGTASAKTRAEVRGGGKKPHPQKGQGRARAGSIRSPVYKGGGVAFPPKPRSFQYALPKKVLQFGLKSALSAKLAQEKLFIIDNTGLDSHKTANLKLLLQQNKWDNSLIIDGDNVNSNLRLASSNLPQVDVLSSNEINVYSIMLRENLILSRDSISWLKDQYFKRELEEQQRLLTLTS